MDEIKHDKEGGKLADLNRFCLIDVGSTTTKAILFANEGEWRFFRREAPTTVEKPFEDVTCGALAALEALEKETGISLLRNGVPCVPCYSTSSAGGGLAVVVAGLVLEVTARSAERVALGAGAIVQDVIALNDDRTPYKKIEALKSLRPDMVLLAGGFDGGTVHGPVYLAELLNQSGLHPKLAERERLPVIYAGNTRAAEYVAEQLAEKFIYRAVPNLRPSDYRENLDPARHAIHEVFMNHVMSKAPGYDKYKTWVSAPILPTPAAVSQILELASCDLGKKIMVIDIGGATTDVFTAEKGKVFRTVSANLGMSYSILNVVKQAGIEAVMEVLDLDLPAWEILDRIGNKFLRPTQLPDNRDDALIECAVAAIAIREAIREHLSVLSGISISQTEEELSRSVIRRRKKTKKNLSPNLSFAYDLVIGSGGILSHSPRKTTAMILTNAILPEESVELAVDSVFMFPHLGVLSQADPDLALELFYRFGLVRLGTVVAPSGTARPGKSEVKLSCKPESGPASEISVPHGATEFIPVGMEEDSPVRIKPGKLNLKRKEMVLEKGAGPLIIDARGRPPMGKTGYFLPDDYRIDSESRKTENRREIYQGDIVERRELAVAGEVLIKTGDNVGPETIVAKSSRLFLRPFFLHVADALGVSPEDLPSCLEKKAGDEIRPGEVIARRRMGVINVKDFISPVSAVIEKIIPDGTIIAREKPDFAQKSYAVDVARDLNTKPSKIGPELVVKVGQEVEKGQLLAGNLIRKGPARVSRSPIRGKVVEIDLGEGIVTVEPLLEELELNAWIPGRVQEVTDKGCLIANQGAIIPGIWGSGGEAFGRIKIDDGGAGDIVVSMTASRDDLTRLQESGVTGLITGSLHLRDYEDTAPKFAVVITEGFGTGPMNRSHYEKLMLHTGKIAAVDAATQLRAGVKRPRIILPENG